jgi:hypothetical protein
MPKKYRVPLTEADREWLIEFIGRGMAPAREQARARVLLKADEGPEWNDDQIAEADCGCRLQRRCSSPRAAQQTSGGAPPSAALRAAFGGSPPAESTGRSSTASKKPSSSAWPAQRPRRAAARGACASWPTDSSSWASSTRSVTRPFARHSKPIGPQPTGPQPTPASQASPVGDPTRAERSVRCQDVRCQDVRC